MQKEIQLHLSPRIASSKNLILPIISRELRIDKKRIMGIRILRKSIDSRRKDIKINLLIRVYIDEKVTMDPVPEPAYKNVSTGQEVIIIGSGPAGLFAGLRLIEFGCKPIILERGKEISERKADIALISREHRINPDSNYCFGEGGAGTFSDGKLYTRSKKRGDHRRILNILHWHGAHESILYDAHPHIGSDKLPVVIKRIRKTIEEAGGEIHFNTRVTGFEVKNRKVTNVITRQGDTIKGDAFILATGHSARDIYYALNEKGISIESKPFAVGVRVEHPQQLIDEIQYGPSGRSEYLPPAIYTLNHQVDGRGVYSFCMCPGGFIVPSATSSEEIVVNGMSPSKRNSPYANSGIVVEIQPEDLTDFKKSGAFSGLVFQEALEKKAWFAGGQKQSAPAQRLTDFIEGRISQSLPASSYPPGTESTCFRKWLPAPMYNRLREGMTAFNTRMKGFITEEAIVLGIESRTSSPIRIPRDPVSMHHPEVINLFPCGEGSGFAGGIVSSAVDGERIAEKVVQSMI